jgi:hypothetical protein
MALGMRCMHVKPKVAGILAEQGLEVLDIAAGRRLHGVEVEQRVAHHLPGAVVGHLSTALGDEELGSDILNLLLLWVQLVRVRRVVPPSGSVCRRVL